MFLNYFFEMSYCLYPLSPEVLEKAKTKQGHFTFVLTELDLLDSLSPGPVPPAVLPVSQKTPQATFKLTLQLSLLPITLSPSSVCHLLKTSPSIPPSIHPPIHPSIHPSIHPFMHPLLSSPLLLPSPRLPAPPRLVAETVSLLVYGSADQPQLLSQLYSHS